ncbi:MAG: 4Fe-4S ferredoxin [Candidatus Lokiarchaeota archaeon]|nr:4Fe-4S ferredoxin [Candidatus Lokiarchaeota archaeon]
MEEKNLDIYKELALHLDKMPIGYPPTDSGVEIRILKRLFTPEDAEIALKLDFIPKPLKKIYRGFKKKGWNIEELESKLDKMYEKGIINYSKKKEGDQYVKYYSNAMLIIGMFEYQLNRLSKEFIEDINQYIEESFMEECNQSGIPQLRTIPIEQSIENEVNVAKYDLIRDIIENNGDSIAVAECICRKSMDILGEPCKKTDMRKVCFSFRAAAEAYVDKGLAEFITKDEALDIFRKVEEAGLVIQPGNSMRPMCICCCCDCCCHVLYNQNKLEKPAQFFATNFCAKVNSELCAGCGICKDRCNMYAISIIENISVVNLNRCIGCGVCIPTCPNNAIKLQKKEDEIVPPKNTAATYLAIMDKKAEKARAQKS